MLQRVTLFVPISENPRAVHINDYHFFSRFAEVAAVGANQSVTGHSVVLNDFDDFKRFGGRGGEESE